MFKKRDRNEIRVIRHARVRKKISGTPEMPRLSVYRSLNHIYAQVIDDTVGNTLAAASTVEKESAAQIGEMDKKGAAKLIGKIVAERAQAAGIKTVVFDIRKESNPCSLCANMRRGALHRAAKDLGCRRVALGHHFDDVVGTFMLNLFYEGRLGCFQPVTYLSNTGINLIRPMIYAQEKDVQYFARRQELPIVKSLCPEDHATERENMKKLLAELERSNKGLRHRIFTAMCRGEIDGFKLAGRYPDPGKDE